MRLLLIALLIINFYKPTFSQTQEAQQLMLNVEKLAQLKQILNDMYKGYQIVSKGYNTIKDISKGNFNLHKAFLDGLMEVSPIVKKYKRVFDIIERQGQIVKEYKIAFKRFNASNQFNFKEIRYMSQVYTSLLDRSLKGLDELSMIITAGRLRMSDEERLAAIDKIFGGMEDKLSFLRTFNRGNMVLEMQRGKESIDTKIAQQLYGLH